MNEQNKSDNPSFQMPSVAIVALILGFFVFKDTAFESSRPAMPDADKTSSEYVHSRLWQDPFEAVEIHLENLKQKNNRYGYEISFINSEQEYLYKYAFKSFRSSSEKNPFKELSEEIKENFATDEDTHDLWVLAVMVPGGVYEEDKEWRLRNRYALITGLATEKYIPADPEHINFVDLFHQGQVEVELKENDYSRWRKYIPYEWFCLQKVPCKDSSKKILILWIDNDALDKSKKPLAILADFKKQLKPAFEQKNGNFYFNIIGPSNSSTFDILHEEISWVASECSNLDPPKHCADLSNIYKELNDSLIFSPFATIEGNKGIEDTNSLLPVSIIPTDTRSHDKRLQTDSDWLKQRIFRTINTNNDLASTLVCELSIRGVITVNLTESNRESIKNKCALLEIVKNPQTIFASQVKKKNDEEREEKNYIALIGEWDTGYSRNLIELVKTKLRKYNGNENIANKVLTFNYLRGIDGVNPKTIESGLGSAKDEAVIYGSTQEKTQNQIRRPTGSYQFDYLRRLVQKLDDINNELDRNKKGSIKAFGILGNDPYDKLLILQALHKRFPQALFFTTDLDARLLHPSELKWTRNLVVASPYGLTLHRDLQVSAPPFRDTYQTALYLTTKLAVDCRLDPYARVGKIHCYDSKNSILDKMINNQPRLFEIGNYSAVDLSYTDVKGFHPLPESHKKMREDRISLLFAFLILMGFFLHFLVPEKTRPIVYLMVTGLAIVLVVFVILQSQESAVLHTFSFTNGTSTWPANAVRLFALFTAIWFFVFLKQQLASSNQKISEQFIPTVLHGNDQKIKSPNNENWGSLLFIDKWNITKVRNKKNNSAHFVDLWNHYLKMRRFKYCILRVFIMFLLYAGCIFLLYQTGYFEKPNFPTRGITSYWINKIILISVVFAYLVLIFAIADITHLSSHFIKLLKTQDVIWPKEILDGCIKKYGASDNEGLAKNKLKMDLISRLAGDVNSFIYYPFIILFLLILSRSHYFDNWHYTPLLFMIISFTAVIAVGSAVRLRSAAINTKEDLLEKLKLCYLQSITHEAQQKNGAQHHGIKLLTEEVKNMNTGPFQPIERHPIVLSLLMPLGSVGGLYLIEYFLGAA